MEGTAKKPKKKVSCIIKHAFFVVVRFEGCVRKWYTLPPTHTHTHIGTSGLEGASFTTGHCYPHLLREGIVKSFDTTWLKVFFSLFFEILLVFSTPLNHRSNGGPSARECAMRRFGKGYILGFSIFWLLFSCLMRRERKRKVSGE